MRRAEQAVRASRSACLPMKPRGRDRPGDRPSTGCASSTVPHRGDRPAGAERQRPGSQMALRPITMIVSPTRGRLLCRSSATRASCCSPMMIGVYGLLFESEPGLLPPRVIGGVSLRLRCGPADAAGHCTPACAAAARRCLPGRRGVQSELRRAGHGGVVASVSAACCRSTATCRLRHSAADRRRDGDQAGVAGVTMAAPEAAASSPAARRCLIGAMAEVIEFDAGEGWALAMASALARAGGAAARRRTRAHRARLRPDAR